MWRRIVFETVVAASMGAAALGQLPMPGAQQPAAPNPLTDATASPGTALLYRLEAEFEKAVAAQGGTGFASWFAPDGVVLGNGVAPVVGKVAIAQSANWTAKAYQLTWTPTGAWMGPSGETGYTWGHYEGHSKDANGDPVNTSGRYITVWGKQPDGSWKVELEASANEPAEAGSCCRLPGH
ncbi:MAG TPA: nuclear transport factor 2 family protein [Terracidiphilus sp.]|nr:nuclear transport factor 2 family protein [Terracidiphilus sp.]